MVGGWPKKYVGSGILRWGVLRTVNLWRECNVVSRSCILKCLIIFWHSVFWFSSSHGFLCAL